MGAASLTKRPQVLYEASLEHMTGAEAMRQSGQWVLAIYIAGLAVECVPQALALQASETSDARHDLRHWLSKCPSGLQATMTRDIPEQWSILNTVWDNRLRYLSEAGLLGYPRRLKINRVIKGGPDAILKEHARLTVEAARAVHQKGASIWQTYSKK